MDMNPQDYLRSLSQKPDSEINIAVAAIAMAALQQPGISTERYIHHFKKLTDETAQRFAELREKGAEDNVQTRLAALKHIIADKHGYTGDEKTFDDIQNANIIRVIERGKGMPIALSLLYICTARALGWEIDGLDVPGHFVCRLSIGGQRLIFDPFENCKILEASDIRHRLKDTLGERAELSARYFEPVLNRNILIGMQNNIKFRKIAIEDYEGALEIVETMRLIDPGEYRLLLDGGVLNAKLGRYQAAIEMLEPYIAAAPHGRDRQEAQELLYEIRLNLK